MTRALSSRSTLEARKPRTRPCGWAVDQRRRAACHAPSTTPIVRLNMAMKMRWRRKADRLEPVYALVTEKGEDVIGFVHSTSFTVRLGSSSRIYQLKSGQRRLGKYSDPTMLALNVSRRRVTVAGSHVDFAIAPQLPQVR
jgi:hypothetical protein